MSTIVKGLEIEKKELHPIADCFCFIDDDNDVFIVGDENIITNISSPMFTQYQARGYETIEEFLRIEYDTQLVKVLKKLNQFDIEIIVK
jgi:hypothetical protein